MTPPLNLGVLGCADVAVRRVLPAASALPELRVTAVASRDEDKVKAVAERFGATPVTGYDRLLARDDVDAVYVPLPSGLHAPWVRKAIEAGKHVLAEKPLTTDLLDTIELVGLAKAGNLVLRENFMFVHHSQHQRVRDMLASGAIGEPRSFSATFAIPRRKPGDIRLRPELGGGALLDVGAYPLRAAQLVLGPELEVVGAALKHDSELGVDVAGSALVRWPDGVTGQLTFGLDHMYTSRYEVLGSTGRLSVEHVFTPPPDHQPVVRIHRQNHEERLTLTPDDQCANTLRAFVRAVRHGPLADPSTVVQAELVESTRSLAGVPTQRLLEEATHG